MLDSCQEAQGRALEVNQSDANSEANSRSELYRSTGICYHLPNRS